MIKTFRPFNTRISHFFLCIYCLFICIVANASPADNHYTIIIDAGSSSSRLHIYEYAYHPESQQAFVINEISPSNNAVKPGLSGFAAHPEAAGPALKPLLDQATAILQAKGVDVSQVEFNVLATAGMRLVPEPAHSEIYRALTDYLSLNTRFKINTVGTISGKMEGVYGWLAVNYFQNNLQAGKTTTTGALDLGGASTQFVYETSAVPKSQDKYSFSLFGKYYTLFAHSFLGLGIDQARTKIASLACYPKGYSVPGLGMGNFNYASCSAAVNNMLSEEAVSAIVPTITHEMDYLAFSGYYYAAKFFHVTKLTDLAPTIQQECTYNWEELQKRHPNDPAQYVANYCFNGVYMHELLVRGYQFPEDDPKLQFNSKAGDKDIDWSPGFIVLKLIRDITPPGVALPG